MCLSSLIDNKREGASLDDPTDELVSYFQLLRRSPDVAEDHELLFCVQIDARRDSARRASRRMGGGDLGVLAVLGSEVGQVADQLDAAGITVTGVLTRRGIAAAIRDAYDPWGREERQRSAWEGIAETTAGPMARDEHWSHIATDGRCMPPSRTQARASPPWRGGACGPLASPASGYGGRG